LQLDGDKARIACCCRHVPSHEYELVAIYGLLMCANGLLAAWQWVKSCSASKPNRRRIK